MKILITTDLYTTATNGVVRSIQNLTEELVAKGHDVRILTLSENGKSYKNGLVTYIRSASIGFIYPNVRMSLAYRSRFINDIIKWKPDVIHSQCEFFSLRYAVRIARLTGTPIVHTYHTLYEQYARYAVRGERFGKWVVKYLTNKWLKKVDVVIAPTRKVEDALRAYGLDKPIRVVPSGISLEQHYKRMSHEEKTKRRADLNIPEGDIVLLNLGRIGAEKNIEELLNFFASVLKMRRNITLLIVGDGPDREKLEKLSAGLGISDKVIFTGMVEPEHVQDYYQLGDVFISASTSETQGLTYVEAAANGLPLLCRRDAALDDVVSKGENGYEYTSEEEFLYYLEQILNDPDWLRLASKRSEEIARTFDKSVFGDSIEEIYKSVLG